MNEHFETVIVGSGFGGSVMAHELATGGMSVCLLERGQAFPPGSFPRSPQAMARNFWDPDSGLFGMFDIWSFRHSEALVAAGLGGGSLIYANVLIRKPAQWFVETLPDGTHRPWPISRAQLDPHYDAVENMLDATPYPFEHEPYNQTPKTIAFKTAAEQLNLRWRTPKLAVTFASRKGAAPVPGEPVAERLLNLHGRPRYTCRLCGECDIGCNYGSKNTLDHNYLTAAAAAGAQIRTLCEVKRLRPRPSGGYEVQYVRQDPAEVQRTQRLETLSADHLVLCAGALGSTYLLLKNRDSFPRISACLGRNYSTNGDLLTFAIRCRDQSKNPRHLAPGRGPVITSTIDVETSEDGGFLIQDAGHPEFVSWLTEMSDVSGWLRRSVRFVLRRVCARIMNDPCSEIDGQIAELIGRGELSGSSVPLLGMGRDRPNGTLTLRRRRSDGKLFLDTDWRRRGSREFFKAVTSTSRAIAESLGGRFVENPGTRYFGRIITVHPLGGCSMARAIDEGVVNCLGEVFNYPGLYVADGSVMPGPVGTNPSLTIAAVARHIATGILNGSRAKSPPNGGT